jgi:hypothetical protein
MDKIYTNFGVEGNNYSHFDQSIVKREAQPLFQKWKELAYSFVEIISSNGVYEVTSSDTSVSDALLEVASITEMQNFIESKLSFNPTQMAKMLGITRQSYYNHRKHLPISDSTINSYQAAYEMVREIDDRFPSAFRGMKSVLVGGKSLASWLSNSEWAREDILTVAQSVHEKMDKVPVTGRPRLSSNTQNVRSKSITRRG